MFKNKYLIIGLALLAVVAIAIIYKNNNSAANKTVVQPNKPNNKQPEQTQRKPFRGNKQPIPVGTVPEHAQAVYNYVIANKKAMSGYVGGRTFQNRERVLPRLLGNGELPKYQEWDVWPKIQGQSRGAERIVTDQQKNGYYTSDHYKTFIKIQQ
jgi:ribonuclease T1